MRCLIQLLSLIQIKDFRIYITFFHSKFLFEITIELFIAQNF